MGKKTENSSLISDVDELEKIGDDFFSSIQDDVPGNQGFGDLIGDKKGKDQNKIWYPLLHDLIRATTSSHRLQNPGYSELCPT